jgi:hypothetical protein
MKEDPSIQINITLPRDLHNHLVKMAALRNLEDPGAGATKGGLAREMLCKALRELTTPEDIDHGASM